MFDTPLAVHSFMSMVSGWSRRRATTHCAARSDPKPYTYMTRASAASSTRSAHSLSLIVGADANDFLYSTGRGFLWTWLAEMLGALHERHLMSSPEAKDAFCMARAQDGAPRSSRMHSIRPSVLPRRVIKIAETCHLRAIQTIKTLRESTQWPLQSRRSASIQCTTYLYYQYAGSHQPDSPILPHIMLRGDRFD